jgi:hypothetical protein
MAEIKGNNGATINIKVAPFKDVMALKNAIVKELASIGLNLDSLDLKNFNVHSDINIDAIIKPLASIDSSELFYNAIMKCLVKCTYNGHKITEELFEEEEAREDYYLIIIEALKVNLSPFLKGLVSGFASLVKSAVTK